MNRRLLRALLILPGNVLVLVPALILIFTRTATFSWEMSTPARLQFWLALACVALGGWLMASTFRLFVTQGEGTPAPWNPPKKLVVRGVYRRVRNPMISGVIFTLCAEALFFQSLPLALWAALFVLANMVYIPNFEEPGLEKRFGEDYRVYKANVPRWLPRPTPWNGEG
jgi:protein-S-isoprenylcysteine O-methyltransferase Ste14